MHTWPVLRWAWAAVVIVYCVLAFVADQRLHGGPRKRNRNIFLVVVVLAVIRSAVRLSLGGGQVYRFAEVVVGIAAGVGALIAAKTLIGDRSGGGDEVVGVESADRIQSLKLD